jgi:peptidoglycan hydrolase CwlO-like protein
MRPKGSKNKTVAVEATPTPVEDLRTLLSEKIAKYDTLIAEAAKEIERHQAKISRVNAERAELHSLIEQYNQKIKKLSN